MPLGHGLIGLAIAKKTKVNPVLAFILASSPDIDFLLGLFFAGGNMLALHRTLITHTPFFAAFVAGLFWAWGKIRGRKFSKRYLWGIFFIVCSHFVLDLLSYVLPYSINNNIGKHGFSDFMGAHILSLEFVYNNFVDLIFYGTIYFLVVKFVFKERKLV